MDMTLFLGAWLAAAFLIGLYMARDVDANEKVRSGKQQPYDFGYEILFGSFGFGLMVAFAVVILAKLLGWTY